MAISPKLRTAIKAMALIAIVIFLPFGAGFALHEVLPTSPLPTIFVLPSLLAVSTLGLAPAALCLALAAGALAIIMSWRFWRRWWMRALLVAGLAAIIAFPFLYRYQPAVIAAPGHELRLATAPHSFCQHLRRQSHIFWEIRRCEYKIVGWDEEGTLFYDAACGHTPAQLWAYAPDSGSPPAPVAHPPQPLSPATPFPGAVDFVRADVYPPAAEESVRALALRQPWALSPDGRWAATVARHIYDTVGKPQAGCGARHRSLSRRGGAGLWPSSQRAARSKLMAMAVRSACKEVLACPM